MEKIQIQVEWQVAAMILRRHEYAIGQDDEMIYKNRRYSVDETAISSHALTSFSYSWSGISASLLLICLACPDAVRPFSPQTTSSFS